MIVSRRRKLSNWAHAQELAHSSERNHLSGYRVFRYTHVRDVPDEPPYKTAA